MRAGTTTVRVLITANSFVGTKADTNTFRALGTFRAVSIITAGLTANGPAHIGHRQATVVLALRVDLAIGADRPKFFGAHLDTRSFGNAIFVFFAEQTGELRRAVVGV